MKLLETDLDQSFYQSLPQNTDRSIGYLFAVLIAIGFFLLCFAGLYRVQTVSNQVVSDHGRPDVVIEPEISDWTDSKNR
ncbi:hypothetical protein [Schlesneria paludicola]|uniref:hypothetical protein n=1 Tax=Schlesneria paludicola TaxID=360056 RepID=UPI00029A8146|nr:hypothetical protein [Schlesneria paludicola]